MSRNLPVHHTSTNRLHSCVSISVATASALCFQVFVHQDGARINVDTATVNPPPITIVEHSKWAAAGHNIIFADANSDCIRKHKDRGCEFFKPGSAHYLANQLILQGELHTPQLQFAPVLHVHLQHVHPASLHVRLTHTCHVLCAVILVCSDAHGAACSWLSDRLRLCERQTSTANGTATTEHQAEARCRKRRCNTRD